MMLNNTKAYLKTSNPLDPNSIDAFRISEVLAICTGKLKEDIVLELLK